MWWVAPPLPPPPPQTSSSWRCWESWNRRRGRRLSRRCGEGERVCLDPRYQPLQTDHITSGLCCDRLPLVLIFICPRHRFASSTYLPDLQKESKLVILYGKFKSGKFVHFPESTQSKDVKDIYNVLVLRTPLSSRWRSLTSSLALFSIPISEVVSSPSAS